MEDKNIKILCKNIRYSRARQWHGRASKSFKEAIFQRAWHGSCLQAHGRARRSTPLYVVLRSRLARPCL